MTIEYDADSDAAVVWLVKPQIIGHELWPVELKEHIGLLFDKDKKLIGIEVLFASAHLPEDVLARAIDTSEE